MISRRKISGEGGEESPLKLFVFVALAAFLAEILVMAVLRFLPLSHGAAVFLDSIFLVLLLCPALICFVHTPLSQKIMKLKQAESEKERLISELQDALANI